MQMSNIVLVCANSLRHYLLGQARSVCLRVLVHLLVRLVQPPPCSVLHGTVWVAAGSSLSICAALSPPAVICRLHTASLSRVKDPEMKGDGGRLQCTICGFMLRRLC